MEQKWSRTSVVAANCELPKTSGMCHRKLPTQLSFRCVVGQGIGQDTSAK
jgi:hypothetical protein